LGGLYSGADVVLDGSGSCGGELTYEWTWWRFCYRGESDCAYACWDYDSDTHCQKQASSATDTVAITVQDLTPPEITITGITDGATYTLGSVPVAGYTATDPVSGIDSENAVLTGGNANNVGTYTYTVNATDRAGNARTVIVNYTVVYTFSEFLTPLNLGGPFKLGSTIPIKFQLMNAGDFISTGMQQ
jgi:hypothetical protein